MGGEKKRGKEQADESEKGYKEGKEKGTPLTPEWLPKIINGLQRKRIPS